MNIEKLILIMLTLFSTLSINCMEEPAPKRLRTETPLVQENVNQVLFNAIEDGNLEQLQKLFNDGASIHTSNRNKETLLHRAIINENTQVAEFLLNHGADIETVDAFGNTPLLTSEDEDIIRLLVERGAHINAANSDGDTIMHNCSARGADDDILQFLLHHGASINSTNNKGETPLQLAIDNEQLDTASFLLQQGANPNTHDKEGNTPLHQAVRENNEDIITLLLTNGTDSNITNTEGNTPLHTAVSFSPASIVKLLIHYGADVNAKNKEGYSILDTFIQQAETADLDPDNLAVLNALIEHNAYSKMLNKNKIELITKKIAIDHNLQKALEDSNLLSVQNILNSLTIEERNYCLNPALLYAARNDSKSEIVLYILGAGADNIRKALLTLNSSSKNYECLKAQLIRRLPLVEQILRSEDKKLRETVINGMSQLPRELIEKIAKFNPTQALRAALVYDTADMVSLVLKALPHYFNLTTRDEASALSLAACHPNTQEGEKMVKLLLEWGARPTLELLHKLVLTKDIDNRNAIMALIFQALSRPRRVVTLTLIPSSFFRLR
jgi:ankyrin repeat protein